MARIRTIKPEFWKHEDLSALPEVTHMLAAALLNHADDEGYFNANPSLVKAECLPLRESSVSTHDSLTQLARIGFVQMGTGEDGKRYGRVVKFDEHQRVNRATPSKIKAMHVVWEDSRTTHGILSESSPPEGKGREGKGKEQAPPAARALPADPGPVAISIPVNDGTEVAVTETQVTEFGALYPAVDVMAELRKMRGWAISNPTKRKTRGGILRFVNTWLAKQQDSGRGFNAAPNGNHAAIPGGGRREL